MTARRRNRAVAAAVAGALLLALPVGGQTPPEAMPTPLLPDAAGPPAAPAPPAPLPLADAAALPAVAEPSPFDLPAATGRTVDVAGPLTGDLGGYGMGAFAGSDARFLAALMQRIEVPVASRWAHIVLRRALLSESATPAGINPADWIAARSLLLMHMGEIDGAKALLDFVPADRFTPALYRVSGQVHFAAADPAGMCPIAATGVAVSRDPLWQLSEAMCAALNGDDVSAARGFDAVRAQRRVDRFDVMLGERVAALAGAGGRAANIAWDEVDALTPYRFGVTAAAGVAVPAALLAKLAVTTRGASQGWVFRAGGLPTETRAAAARDAGALGIAGVGEIIALRSADANTADGPAADLRRAYVAASVTDRIAALRSIWTSGATERDRYGAHVETALAAARLPVDAALAADAPDIIGSLMSAGLAPAAARWAKVAAGGSPSVRGAGWALLAGGGTVAISPKAMSDWLASADAGSRVATRHRAALLLAALDALGRTRGDSGWDRLRTDLGLAPVSNSWTQAIDAAAAAGRPGEVAVLAATGLQSAWRAVPPAHFGHIVGAYARVGRRSEAELLVAEAVMRG